MAKEYRTAKGRKIIGWIFKNGRRIPITESLKEKREAERRQDEHDLAVADAFLQMGQDKDAQMKSAIKKDAEKADKKTGSEEVMTYGEAVQHEKDLDYVEGKILDKMMKEKGISREEAFNRLYADPKKASEKLQGEINSRLLSPERKQLNEITRMQKAKRNYGETDTSEALAQINSKQKTPKGMKPIPTSNSLSGNMGADGKLTPKREKVHRQIIDEHFEGKRPVQGQPTITLLGGGSASGKDSIFGVKESKKDDHTVVIDPDDIKQKLPHFAEASNASDKAAGFYHEESSALAKRTASVSYDEGYDTIYNGTGDGSRNSLKSKIDEARAKGYRVEGKYATVDTEEAVRRNRQRYLNAVARGENPRLVSDDEVRKIHKNVTNRLVEFAPQFDYVELWDNNGAVGQTTLIATGGGGKWLKAVKGQEEALRKFLAKGDIQFITTPEGYVIPLEKI